MVRDPPCSVSSTEHGLTGRKICGKELAYHSSSAAWHTFQGRPQFPNPGLGPFLLRRGVLVLAFRRSDRAGAEPPRWRKFGVTFVFRKTSHRRNFH
jgi:hypothetical protein